MRKLYTYCQPDGTIIGLLEFNQKPQYSTEKLYQGNFIHPKLNFETDEFYEGATQEEIDLFAKSKVPTSVSKRQLKQALVIAGIPLANIEYGIAQIQDELEKELMQIYWNDSTEFERNHPKLIEFSQALGMSETQVNDLFTMAANL